MFKIIKRKIRQHFIRAKREQLSEIRENLPKDIKPSGYLTKLSWSKSGECKFLTATCDEKLKNRLYEMGLRPGDDISVVANTGAKGNVTIEIKGTKLALSESMADSILVEEKK